MREIKNVEEAPKEEGIILPENRKEKIKMMNALKMSVNFKLMTLDKKDKDFEKTQLELLSQLNGIDTQLTKIKMNRNESKYFEFVPKLGLNRKQRRSK